jgi:hypothetical protein
MTMTTRKDITMTTITGRITGPVYDWTAGGHSFLLKTKDGKKVPIIVESDALFRKCRKGVDLVVNGERNEVECYAQPAGAAIIAAEVERAA